MTETAEQLTQQEGITMLTEAECWDVLFWSFFYSQGDYKQHRRIFNYVRRHYDLPDSFKSRYEKVIDPEFESIPTLARLKDKFEIPEQEMQRYIRFLSGNHTRNTENTPLDAAGIRKSISQIIGEFIVPSQFSDVSSSDLLIDILTEMAYKDHIHSVVKKDRIQSFVFDFVLGTNKRPGPVQMRELLDELKVTASEVLTDTAKEIAVYKLDSMQGEKSLKTVLKEVEIACLSKSALSNG